MTTTTDKLPLDTEIIQQPHLDPFPYETLRTAPHTAGADLFTEQAVHVFVNLGMRDPVDGGAFTGGGFISVCDTHEDGQPDWTVDLSEEGAIGLMGALALAVRDLRKSREVQA